MKINSPNSRKIRFIFNAFQTKMWHSNLEKFRRVLVFDAEKVCVSEKVLAYWKEKKKCSVESARDNTMYNLM